MAHRAASHVQSSDPGTKVIPATNYLLSLLALKLTATRRRVSHVEDLAADPGAALFARLTALPKTTALTTPTGSNTSRQAAFLTALDKATLQAGLATGNGGPGGNDDVRGPLRIAWTFSPCPEFWG